MFSSKQLIISFQLQNYSSNQFLCVFYFFFLPIIGVINRGDSFRRRRSRSNSLAPSSPMSPHHSPADSHHSRVPVDSYRVFMLGGPGVGKNALISQFQTSECINTYEGSGEYIQALTDSNTIGIQKMKYQISHKKKKKKGNPISSNIRKRFS